DKRLKELVGSILLELNEKGEYTIDGLGKLVKSDGVVSFTEEREEETSPLYKPVSELKLIAPPQKEAIIEEAIVEPEDNNDEDLKEEVSPVLDEFEPKGRSINWLWPLIIIIILIVAGAFWYLNPNILDR